MADIPIAWEKITRRLPRGKRYADDRAPTVDEIKKLCEYPDRRIKPLIYTMVSSGIRVGAWDYLRWEANTSDRTRWQSSCSKNDSICWRR